MRERPILFSDSMVRAILECRKTMTRRVVKPQPPTAYPIDIKLPTICPYGQPGDRLWVRETWAVGTRPDPFEGWRDGIEYRADQTYLDEIDDLDLYPVKTPDGVDLSDYESKGWRPSIHMPRWASRLILEVTAVRVEHLQDISEQDAEAEGVERLGISEALNIPGTWRGAFADLWNSINEKRGYGWDTNPWVWVIEFQPASASREEP